jgi:hypothetical protein
MPPSPSATPSSYDVVVIGSGVVGLQADLLFGKHLHPVGVAGGPHLVGHLKVADQRHRFICSRRLSSCSCFLMYSRITVSSRPRVETKYPLAQKCCPTKLRFFSQMDRTLALDKPDHLRDRVFRRNRDHHVNVIRHEMAFLDLALLLQRQLTEDLAEMPSQFPVKRLSAALGNKHNMIFALPLAVA